MSIDNELDTIKNNPYIEDMKNAIHDGIKKGYDKSVTAESYAAEVKDNYDAVLLQWDSDPSKDPELVTARDGEPTLKVRLDRDNLNLNNEDQRINRIMQENKEETENHFIDVESELAQINRDKASISYVDALLMDIAKGGPKGLFNSISDLLTTYPNGDEGTYLVLDSYFTDGAHSFIWNGSEWIDLGVYQAVELHAEDKRKLLASAEAINLKNYAINGKPEATTYYSFNLSNGAVDTTNQEVSFTPTAKLGQLNYGGIGASDILIKNRLIYICLDIKHDGVDVKNTIKAMIATGATNSNIVDIVDVTNEYKRVYLLFDQLPVEKTVSSVLRLFDNAEADWTKISIKNINIFDITESFGFGKEPNKNDLDGFGIPYIKYLDSYNTNIVEKSTESEHAKTADKLTGNTSNSLYVKINNNVIDVVSKYSAFDDVVIRLAKKGVNGLFDFVSFKKIENSKQKVSENLDSAVPFFSNGSDWFGPYVVRATNNIDGDQTESGFFTGGNHGYNNYGNLDNNSTTARTSEVSFFVEGRKVSDFSGLADFVDIYWTNYVQAYNTTKVDGSGREVIKEDYHIHYDGKKWTVSNLIEALEDIVITTYYGLQVVNSSWNEKILYKGSENSKWNNGTVATNSTDKNTESILLVKGQDYLEFGLYEKGLGKQKLNSGQYNSFTSTVGKTYNVLISGANELPANNIVYFKGFYHFYSK